MQSSLSCCKRNQGSIPCTSPPAPACRCRNRDRLNREGKSHNQCIHFCVFTVPIVAIKLAEYSSLDGKFNAVDEDGAPSIEHPRLALATSYPPATRY
eukprot:4398104-Amphidinium_carterae.1